MQHTVRACLMACLAAGTLTASEQRGRVMFRETPVPGAVVTATADGTTKTAVTDPQGFYVFPELKDGVWKIEVEMFGFAPVRKEVPVGPKGQAATWELRLLSLDEIHARIQSPAPAAQPLSSVAQATGAREEDLTQRAADGFLINGSLNNGAASPFAQDAAFGNARTAGSGLYNGGIGIVLDNSALDAAPFSLTGQNTPKPAYNRMTGVLALGGPLRIPHLLKNGPNFFVGYQWTRNNTALTGSGLMPDLALRNGIFPHPVMDPSSGAPFPGNVIPESRVSPQARALLGLYPLPNFANSSRYNYQIPVVSPTHQDALQSRVNKALGPNDQLYGRFALQSTRTDTPNLFGFLDTTDLLGINTGLNWSHRLNQQWFLNLGVQFSSLTTRVTPNFQNRENVSGLAGVTGNDQNPMNWGPPSLAFSSGISGLSDAQSSFDRNRATGVSYAMSWDRGLHNIAFGSDFRRQEFNDLSQQDPRGTFTFTGAQSGSDFADFLLGIPDTSSIAFGNADKYFRASAYDAYFTDEWKLRPGFTLNAGLRWEYGSPITELYNRLVNLDVAPGFGAVAPVLASDPVGPLTGRRYPSSLVQPDKSGFEPRLGIAWRPMAGSSTVVRAGYGIYYDTSVYQTIASQMAQQPPLSTTLSVQNSAADPLTLAHGFTASPSITRNTFAIDPNFRAGYAQDWQFSVQRDLPGSLQMTATYLGIKGTRGMQEFLPNTSPIGATSPCPTCPTGFAYLTSNGNSSREAAQVQLRRRLHNGLTASLQYTFSKSIDDDAAVGGQGAFTGGGPANGVSPASQAIAQNWLDLAAERGLSTFDQRHLLSLQMQYTAGMGLGGGSLLGGWRGALFKEWTFGTQITAGSGLPQTPVYLAPVPGTGVTGTIRPYYTGAPLYAASSGLFLNAAAYTAPQTGQWGNAGRDSITGPAEFSLDASLGRTFRLGDRFNLDLRVDSTNALNHVNFTAWNTIVNNAQFGMAVAANAMRAIQTTLRLRF